MLNIFLDDIKDFLKNLNILQHDLLSVYFLILFTIQQFGNLTINHEPLQQSCTKNLSPFLMKNSFHSIKNYTQRGH
jgi:uncharacterized membrane protein (Fun14 family)